MNETMNTILTRRSTRKFLNRPIPEEELQQIIQLSLIHIYRRMIQVKPSTWM